MKIVHVVYSLEMGGAESLVAQLCRLQRAEGHEVSVCAYSNLGTLGEILGSEGFRVDILGASHPTRAILRCIRLFRRLHPDVVHCHNSGPTIQAAIGARLAGASSLVSTRHSLVAPPYETAEEIKYGVFARLCDHIVGICDATAENLRRAPFAYRSHIVRVYNGVVPIAEVPIATRPEKHGFTLLFVGRLAPVKSLSTLVNAAAVAVARVPDLQLWLVGDGSERNNLEKLVDSLNLRDHVTFWGERTDVDNFFSTADVFAMSSVSEGLPMSLLQAMSIGLPALVTDIGGMAEVVRFAQCGMAVPVGDSPAMAEAIVKLASDPELRASLSANAAASYKAHFTLEQVNSAYMRLYRSTRRSHGVS